MYQAFALPVLLVLLLLPPQFRQPSSVSASGISSTSICGIHRTGASSISTYPVLQLRGVTYFWDNNGRRPSTIFCSIGFPGIIGLESFLRDYGMHEGWTR